MQPYVWKVLTAVLFSIVLAQQISRRWSPTPEAIEHPETERVRKSQPEIEPQTIPVLTTTSGWTYEWRRDRNNYALSSDQCYSAFPELYFEIDRAIGHWSGREISSETIELWEGNEAGVRVLLHDQKLRVVHSRGMERNDFRFRIFAMLYQLERAIASVEGGSGTFPDTEFTIAVDDWPHLPTTDNQTVWAVTRALDKPDNDAVWVIPDFTFWAAPHSYEDEQTAARDHDCPVREKNPMVFWRGTGQMSPDQRDKLLEVTRNRNWADVKEVGSDDEQMVAGERPRRQGVNGR